MKQIEYLDFFGGKNRAYETLRDDFITDVITSKVYVRINGSARDGTIGRVVFPEENNFITESQYNKIKHGAKLIDLNTKMSVKDLQNRESAVKSSKSYATFISARNYAWHKFNLLMDDGKLIKPKAWNHGDGVTFSWLTQYDGPSVNVFAKQSQATREARRVVAPFYDNLGHLVEVDAFVAVYTGATLRTGIVKRFSANGETAYVAIGDAKPHRAMYPEKMIVIDDGTKTRAMLKKLTSNGK